MRKIICGLLLLTSPWLSASKNTAADNNLAKYLARVQMAESARPVPAIGSTWVDSGRLASLATDYKGHLAGDLVTILVVHEMTSANSGNVSTNRSYKASSGVDTLPGKLKTGGLANLLGLHSAEALSGKGNAASTSTLRTSLTGHIAAVLPSGNFVIEAERSIVMNNERQNIVVRGVVRPGDVGPDNTVSSNSLGNLELEIKGKGVISEGVRPPHPILRLLMRIFNF